MSKFGSVKLIPSESVPDDGKFHPDPLDNDAYLCGPETMKLLEHAFKNAPEEEK